MPGVLLHMLCALLGQCLKWDGKTQTCYIYVQHDQITRPHTTTSSYCVIAHVGNHRSLIKATGNGIIYEQNRGGNTKTTRNSERDQALAGSAYASSRLRQRCDRISQEETVIWDFARTCYTVS
jgi:hypothetical protein